MSEVDRALMALRLEVDGGIVDTIKAIVDKEIAGLCAENERLTRELVAAGDTAAKFADDLDVVLGVREGEEVLAAAHRIVTERDRLQIRNTEGTRIAAEGYIALAAERDEARRAWIGDGDEPLPEDGAIEAAFPTRSGRHDLYAEAMRLVGARKSKTGLVALVTWLLVEAERLRGVIRAMLLSATPSAKSQPTMWDAWGDASQIIGRDRNADRIPNVDLRGSARALPWSKGDPGR